MDWHADEISGERFADLMERDLIGYSAMTDEEIESIVDSVNDGSSRDHVFSHHLAGNVSFARVWTKNPKTRRVDVQGYDFYLVHHKTGECIGAVADMQEDLHAFIKPTFRRQGIMSAALRETILPHIFSKERTHQEVTFRDEAGRQFAKKVGFEVMGENKASISASSVKKVDFAKISYSGLDRSRINTLCDNLLDAACLIRRVRDELQITLGDELSKPLSETAWDVQWKCTDVLDYWKRLETDRWIRSRA